MINKNSEIVKQANVYAAAADLMSKNLVDVRSEMEQKESARTSLDEVLTDVDMLLQARYGAIDMIGHYKSSQWVTVMVEKHNESIKNRMIKTLRSYTRKVLSTITQKNSISGYYANIDINVDSIEVLIPKMEFGRTRKVDGVVQKNVFCLEVNEDSVDSHYEIVSDRNFNSANLDLFVEAMLPVIETLTTDPRAISFRKLTDMLAKKRDANNKSCVDDIKDILERAKNINA